MCCLPLLSSPLAPWCWQANSCQQNGKELRRALLLSGRGRCQQLPALGWSLRAFLCHCHAMSQSDGAASASLARRRGCQCCLHICLVSVACVLSMAPAVGKSQLWLMVATLGDFTACCLPAGICVWPLEADRSRKWSAGLAQLGLVPRPGTRWRCSPGEHHPAPETCNLRKNSSSPTRGQLELMLTSEL